MSLADSGEGAVMIPLDLVDEAGLQLRPVDTTSPEFLLFKDSLRDEPLIHPITVRPHPRLPDRYEVVVGMHRYTAYRLLGRQEIECKIRHLDNRGVLKMQIVENASRIETQPLEYAAHLKRLMQYDPEITRSDLAVLLHRGADWVTNTLNLNDLIPQAAKRLETDEMSLSNAYMLAKIPSSYQSEYVEQACSMTTTNFKSLASSVINDFRVSKQQGRLHGIFVGDFQPKAAIRKPSEIQRELETHKIAAQLLTAENAKTPLDGFAIALKWVLQLDAESVDRQAALAMIRHTNQSIRRKKDVDRIDAVVPGDAPPTTDQ